MTEDRIENGVIAPTSTKQIAVLKEAGVDGLVVVEFDEVHEVIPPVERDVRFIDERCPKCGASLITDGTDKWCSLVSGGFERACDWSSRNSSQEFEARNDIQAGEPGNPESLLVVNEQGRWQDAIYKLLCAAVGEENRTLIDGAGCDSGDPLDVTLQEISQAINFASERNLQEISREVNSVIEKHETELSELKKLFDEFMVKEGPLNSESMTLDELLVVLGKWKGIASGRTCVSFVQLCYGASSLWHQTHRDNFRSIDRKPEELSRFVLETYGSVMQEFPQQVLDILINLQAENTRLRSELNASHSSDSPFQKPNTSAASGMDHKMQSLKK